MKAANIYWTATGNTEKVALTIEDGLEESGFTVTRFKFPLDEDILNSSPWHFRRPSGPGNFRGIDAGNGHRYYFCN